MKDRLKYVAFFGMAYLLINASLFLLAKQHLLQKGTIRVFIDYRAFRSEDLSIYWNSGANFSDQNHQTLTTRINKSTYSFKITHIDSLKELRLDPDSKFKLAQLKEIRIDGLIKPIRFDSFGSFPSNGLILLEKEGSSFLLRKTNNSDPYLVLKIPVDAKFVEKKFTNRDWLIIIFIELLSLLIIWRLKKKIILFTEEEQLSQVALIGCFLIFISAYWTNLFLNYYETPPSIENRNLARKPNSDSIGYHIKKYFNDYTAWFNDHYAFKQLLVFANSYLKINIFLTSPMPYDMYIGKKFQFFSGNDLLRDDIIGKRRLSPAEISSLYANTLFKQTYLAKQNISYYLTIPPSKQTVYESSLPDYLLLQLKGKKMVRQFVEEIAANKSRFYVDVIDLLKQRHYSYPDEKVFYQYDLHWSDWGAFLAYQKLITAIYKEHEWVGKALNINEIKIDTLYEENADLAKLILMHKTFKKERYLLKAKGLDAIKETVINGVYPFPIYNYKNPAAKGRVLVFRDSYSEQWKWLIARHFNESVFIWDQTISQKLINEYKPDIVIQENCEMFLFYLFNPLKQND